MSSNPEKLPMPKGPRGEKRKADVIGNAVLVARIATGEVVENITPEPAAATLGRKGGRSRAVKLSAKRRKEIAQKAAATRWNRD